MGKIKIQPGSIQAAKKFHITIAAKGPYLVYGMPPLRQEFIMNNRSGESWYFQVGRSFKVEKEPTALCRCGHSKHKPYCDGSHTTAEWKPELTASEHPLLEDAEVFEGQTLNLSDNRAYCAFARFCDAAGQVWNLVGESDKAETRELTIREASLCPSGRLSAWDVQSQKSFEPHYDPSLALIEDTPLGVSGPLWVKGGIPVAREDGYVYEVRNRMTLCRCGASSNKPFCDGTHASIKFQDGIEGCPEGDTIPADMKAL